MIIAVVRWYHPIYFYFHAYIHWIQCFCITVSSPYNLTLNSQEHRHHTNVNKALDTSIIYKFYSIFYNVYLSFMFYQLIPIIIMNDNGDFDLLDYSVVAVQSLKVFKIASVFILSRIYCAGNNSVTPFIYGLIIFFINLHTIFRLWI